MSNKRTPTITKCKWPAGCNRTYTPFRTTDRFCVKHTIEHRKSKQTATKAPKPIKQQSAKRAKQNRSYLKERINYLEANPVCGVKTCYQLATQIHHKRGRVGSLLTDARHFLGTCAECHQKIELNPEWAKENGYSETRTNGK